MSCRLRHTRAPPLRIWTVDTIVMGLPSLKRLIFDTDEIKYPWEALKSPRGPTYLNVFLILHTRINTKHKRVFITQPPIILSTLPFCICVSILGLYLCIHPRTVFVHPFLIFPHKGKVNRSEGRYESLLFCVQRLECVDY